MELSSLPGTELIVILASYVLGCLSVGYYLVRFRTGQDIRGLGSGSAGSSNVARVLGAPGFVITLVADVAKGASAAWAAFYFGLTLWGVMLVMIAVVMGQIWPVQLGFRGGKGVATALGAVLVFDYRLVILVLLLTGLILAVARQRTVSGLVAVAFFPGVAAIMGHSQTGVIGVSALALLILFAHRANIEEIVRAAHGTSDERE